MWTATITGNLLADAESKFTPSGTPMTTFNVAVNVGWGEKKHMCPVRCAKFGKGADKVAQYLTKGTKVVVTGNYDDGLWQPPDGGEPRINRNLTVSELEFASSGGGGQRRSPSASAQAPAPKPAPKDFDDDIPF